MCGICGFISKQNITRDELHSMNETMIHRGPDDGGVEIYPMKQGYSIGLAQRRLAILDLSSLGHQPMHSADGRVSVVYNGEIYNFRQIREELKGYPFISDCDTEVIIAAYLKWGISCVDHFNGMFAICLYDREGDIVYLEKKKKKADKPNYDHVVQVGESMHSIAQMYGIQIKSLYKMNKKDKDYIPEEGDVLKLR